MDLNNLKEEFINTCNNGYNFIINSPGFYFVKEKYDHLSSVQRKIIHTSCLLILLCILFYYPTSYLYSSWKNMRNFNIKHDLTRELVDISSTKHAGVSSSYIPGQNPVKFIERRMPLLKIPKNQVKKIKKSNNMQHRFPFSAKVETVEVEVQNLNLKEVVEYGYKLEQLSGNIKLVNLHIKENMEKDNYFNVSYILSFFSLTKDTPSKIKNSLPKKKTILPDKKSQVKPSGVEKFGVKGLAPKEKRQRGDENPIPTGYKSKKENRSNRVRNPSPPSANDKIFDNLKTPPPPSPDLKLNLLKKKKWDKKNDPTVLMELKKENISKDSLFENRSDKVKKRDLLPSLPTPKNQLENLPPTPSPPSPLSSDQSPPPNNNTTTKDK